MSKKSNILYLYAELMGYQIPVFKELLNYVEEVHVVHWDLKKKTVYSPPTVPGVKYYNRSELGRMSLLKLIDSLNPKLIYISGWMDIGYLQGVFYARIKGYTVVTMFDDIWYSTLKQRVAKIIFPFIRKFFFSHAWVAGYMQYDYARKLGFAHKEIITASLSADFYAFNEVYLRRKSSQSWKSSKSFVYVGRFSHEKGLEILRDVWHELVEDGLSRGWSLTYIGSGPIIFKNSIHHNFCVKPFLMPENLTNEIENFTCFILPSYREPWGLVVHEFAAAGFPILVADTCGAAKNLVIDEYNGLKFDPSDKNMIRETILTFINLNECSYETMGERSYSLAKSITPEVSAANLMSIIDDYKCNLC